MSVNLNIVDRKLLAKAIKDMTGAERELTKLRARDVARAVSSISPDFKRLVALQILEEDGLISEGSVEQATSAREREDDASPEGSSLLRSRETSSVFAKMRNR
jgi:hypothetical protein